MLPVWKLFTCLLIRREAKNFFYKVFRLVRAEVPIHTIFNYISIYGLTYILIYVIVCIRKICGIKNSIRYVRKIYGFLRQYHIRFDVYTIYTASSQISHRCCNAYTRTGEISVSSVYRCESAGYRTGLLHYIPVDLEEGSVGWDPRDHRWRAGSASKMFPRKVVADRPPVNRPRPGDYFNYRFGA